MPKIIGFLTTGANQDTYLYVENGAGESLALGADVGTGTYNLNTLSTSGAIPDEATSNIAIDPGVNGDLVLQPNGTGTTYINNGDFNIAAGDFQLVNGEITLGGINGTDGQLIIGSTAGLPAWANLTSTGGTISITNGSNTINLEAGGGMLSQVNTDAGSATPVAGILNAFGGDNINTAGAGQTVTINLNDYIFWTDTPDATHGAIYVDSTRYLYTLNYTPGLGASTYLGLEAGSLTATSGTNTAVGALALTSVTTGTNNTVLGHVAGTSILDGGSNVCIGVGAGLTINSGGGNTLVGMGAGDNITTGGYNTIVGLDSGTSITTGSYNVVLGPLSKTSGGGSSNIIISNVGTSESNTIRIGTQGTGNGQQNIAYMAGITSQTITGTTSKPVVIETTGQLGVAGNLNIPATNSAFTSGTITQGATRVFHTYSAGAENVFIGSGAGNGTLTGVANYIMSSGGGANLTTGGNNTGMGQLVFEDLVSGGGNCAFGTGALRNVLGSQNVGMGNSAGSNITTGSYNTCLGYVAGSAAIGAGSSNIYLVNAGAAESNTIRIGTQGTGNGQQDTTYIAGIYGVTPAGATESVIIDSNGQLGSAAAPVTSVSWNVATGSTQAAAVNNGYFANYNGTLAFTLPATAAVGDTIEICQMYAGQGWSLAQNAGQTCYIGNTNTTTGAGGSLASTDDGDWIELVCRVADTDWQVNVKSGNITVV